MTLTKHEHIECERLVTEVIHSANIEGLTVSESAVADSGACIAGIYADPTTGMLGNLTGAATEGDLDQIETRSRPDRASRDPLLSVPGRLRLGRGPSDRDGDGSISSNETECTGPQLLRYNASH